LVDSLSFLGIHLWLETEPETARLAAFVVAVFTTWLGNRYLTFRSACREDATIQWMRHSFFALIGFGFNFAIFNYLLQQGSGLQLAFLGGVVMATLVNFLSSKYFVFNKNA